MEKKKLTELAKLVGGYAFKSTSYTNEGIRIIRIANVQDGYIADDYPCFYSYDIVDELGEANLQENDLLMSLTGNVGRVAILPKEMLPAGLNQRVECIRPYNPKLKDYLYYFFKSRDFRINAEKNSTGVAQLNMSTKWLGDYTIPIFDDKKTQQIVTSLKCIEQNISKCESTIRMLDELVKSRFIEMFGDPILNDNKLPLKKLSEISKLKSGKAIKTGELINEAKDGLYPCFGGNGLRGYINRYSNDGEYPIIGRQGALAGNVNYAKGQFYATEHAIVAYPISDYNPLWYYYALTYLNLMRFQTGAAQPGLSVEKLNEVLIPFPDLEEQNNYSNFVKQIDKSKFNVQKCIDFYKELLEKKMDEYFND